jgi:chromosome segregation ATPase
MMTNDFISDQETIAALQQLTNLINQGLQQAWDPNLITQARTDINSEVAHCQQAFADIDRRTKDLVASLELIEEQRQELIESLRTAEKVTNTMQKMGGVEQLRQDFNRLEELRSVIAEMGKAQATAQQLQSQTEQLRSDGDRLQRTLTDVGGAEALLAQLAQLQEIADQLASLDSRIEDTITLVVNRYLPTFEAGQNQIEQWQGEVKQQVAANLATVEQNKRAMEQLVERLVADKQQLQTQLKQLEQQRSQLEPLLANIAKIVNEFKDQPFLEWVTERLSNLDQIIAQQKQSLVSVKTDLRTEFQQLFVQELENCKNEQLHMNRHLLAENQYLKQQVEILSQDLNYHADQLRRLQSIKCDRPVWTLSNLRRPPHLPG